jgi:hypothetical protein
MQANIELVPYHGSQRTNQTADTALLLLARWADHWITGVSVEKAAADLGCSIRELQPAFDVLTRTGFIKAGQHGYVSDRMLDSLRHRSSSWVN